mmetsp:Transcript_27950/g.58525  ORF Transcript_27950/g.58525 Transcript_27950/m.58525 type:complete len:965 (-) Transcript_27950:75-2969(-)|eukprot:CAMPEP_0172477036 /NCGR_PEP_ID=MMETSP1065-20121228/70686_1 /TAXON_ID=265537 /ORGANISM="Amphiprora paludosa, Strain CCMP125" /LENGTH=964 /DNA_ID=CAMNT_0013235275 /DNA_START=591 /DNA_END=3485 /DNA_ORIENTATION=+
MAGPTAEASRPAAEAAKQPTPPLDVKVEADHAGNKVAPNESPKPKSSLPPKVITVETSKGEEPHQTQSFPTEAEGRTPKHANKAPSSEERTEPERSDGERHQHPGAFFPPRPFGGGPTGAFQPHPRSGHQAHMRSPGSGRYYTNFPPPGSYPPGAYEREYQQRPGYSQQHPGMYPPHYQQQGSYSQSWGAPPPGYHGRPPAYPQHGMAGQHPPHGPGHAQHPTGSSGSGPATTGDSTFSRAVSGSFDRSVKSKSSDDKTGATHPTEHEKHVPPAYPPAPMAMSADGGSVSDDGSWKQLNQIQSVDEEEIRKRIEKKEDEAPEDKHPEVKPANSNSSSLTNSPTEGVEKMGKKATLPDPRKMTSSLDSLASVSSAQAPLKTEPDDKLMSPADQSLDLMKCSSGSSALLLPNTSQTNAPALKREANDSHAPTPGKRSHDGDDAEDMDTDTNEGSEKRASKKGRTASMDGKKSPLSIACSPSADNHDAVKPKSQGDFPPKDNYYDKPLTYSYSLESMGVRGDFPPMLARPHSSASSTGTPMQVGSGADRTNAPSRLGVTQLPSWELQGQDSFGAQSTGNPLAPSFSFSHDYPMMAPPGAVVDSHPPPPPPPPHHPPPPPPPPAALRYAERGAMESRNQSFEGGPSYPGSFSRAETMSFESRQGIAESRSGYQGQFPPHAPSWGSAGSFPQPSGYPGLPPHHYRMTMQPMVMRSYSQDSEHHRMGGFQPPSEFQAPPTNINRNRERKETHLMTTPFEPSKSGVFGWTKEEDMRLTEIMKKYKNPRDWEPISKELDRNRSAKECHERWIRYLKPGVRKGQWTDQEDAIVMEAVTSSKEQPFTRWSDLAQRLPGRVGKQIRDRWVNHLNPNINHLPFSREDDLLLWEGHTKVGKRWVEIATKFFKGSRSENHIKNRWYSASFKKFISNEFGAHAYNSKGGNGGSRSPKKDSKKKQVKRESDEEPTFSVGV